MEYKKTLLGAASLLALTAAASAAPADATVSRQQDQRNVQSARVAEVPTDLTSDPLFELIARTGGALTVEAIEKAIPQMFVNATADQLRQTPEILNSLASLGVSASTLERAKEILMALVASAQVTDEMRASITSRLQADPRAVQLAQQRPRCDPRTGRLVNGRCEPLATGSTRDRDPNSTGQVPGGTPGVGRGGGYGN